LQAVFNIIQTQLSELKLILNVDKTKVMLFSKAKKTPETTLEKYLKWLPVKKYLGIWLDNCLSFKLQVNNLLRKLRVKLGFFFKNKSCFSL